MQIETFTGGIFDTNSFFLPESGILIDAPQDAAAWLTREGHRVKTLLLTHGHIDHVWDAAAIQRIHGCRVAYHADTEPMVTQADFFRNYGFAWDVEPITPDWLLTETPSQLVEGVHFQVLLVPGHCDGSLCFFEAVERVLFGGDVLFAGGVGRWDLPGGDRDLLFSGIKSKVFPLGDDVTVLPGHGPATKIGIERSTNPYLA
ncbi:MAG: putative metallo-hydrolase [Chthoniobacter sp.]|jgi:hydroxyacylglutathione hydrolase|nr:putative metallo-hydrolase [Chthoniobacter sp.]